MKVILIAVVALLVLGGGGVGAYLYFTQAAQAAPSPEGDDPHAQMAEHGSEEKDHGNKSGGHGEKMEFVELDPLILPIVDNEGVTQVVSLVVALEVADSEAAGKVEHMTPKLKDAFIQDLYGMLSKHAAVKGGVIQVIAIKERLNKISTQVMGEGVVQDVLLQVVQQRPV